MGAREHNPFEDTTRTLDPAQPPVEDKPRPYLLVLAGTSVGEMHRIAKETTVMGRGDKVDVRLVDVGAGDGFRHERGRARETGGLRVEDLGHAAARHAREVRRVRLPCPAEAEDPHPERHGRPPPAGCCRRRAARGMASRRSVSWPPTCLTRPM